MRAVKDGVGGNSDVIFESKLEFDFLGNQCKLTYVQHIVHINAIGLSPDCVFE